MKHCCKVCQVEYQRTIKVCPECGNKLVTQAPDEPNIVAVRAIYSVANLVEEGHILLELKRHGLRFREKREHVSQLPTANDTYIIAVHPEDVAKALEHIKQMREDNIISSAGAFLT